jgi:hypothetical protein
MPCQDFRDPIISSLLPVAEMALAHGIGNQVEAAYRRGDLFEKRRRLMDAWEKFINQVQTNATVTPIRGAK